MKKTLFTDAMIKKLKPVEKEDYTRSEGNGVTIHVIPSGVTFQCGAALFSTAFLVDAL